MRRLNLMVCVGYLNSLTALTTFSYAVLFSSLAIYLTSGAGLSYAQSNSVVGLFLALNFILHVLSGCMGGRLLSNRMLYVVTLLFQIAGTYILSINNSQYILCGLTLFVIGCGFNSTSLNCLLTQQFEPDDSRRETAFYINYCAMNAGFFLGFLASGYFDLSQNYQKLYSLCNFFNLIAVVLVFFAWKHIPDKPLPLRQLQASTIFKKQLLGFLILILLAPLIYFGFSYANSANYLVLVLGFFMIGLIFYFGVMNKNPIEKGKIYAYLVLTLFSIVFWMLFFVGPMGVMHFLKANVDMQVLGAKMPPQWVMNLNAVFVIFGSPLMPYIWTILRNKGFVVSISEQFVLSLILIGMSFYALSIGIYYANDLGITSGSWVVLHFFTQALAELLLAPVGLAMIGRLAPPQLQGIMMGTWMMVSGIAATLSQHFSNSMNKSESINPLISNTNYYDTFNQLGLYAFIGAVILFVVSRKLEHWIKQPANNLTDIVEVEPQL